MILQNDVSATFIGFGLKIDESQKSLEAHKSALLNQSSIQHLDGGQLTAAPQVAGNVLHQVNPTAGEAPQADTNEDEEAPGHASVMISKNIKSLESMHLERTATLLAK